jgi:FkbM family methyltransferase
MWTVKKIRIHELRMQALAGFYNLDDEKDRQYSATALASLYFDLMHAVSPPLFIEAGALDASVSFRAREVLPSARIVAFEPSPHNVKHYQNRFDYVGKGIEYEQLALADSPGELTFYVCKSVNGIALPLVVGQNSLLKRITPNTVYDEIKVRAVRLDDFFPASASEGCCVWIDVEGSTGKVISGGLRLLGQAQLLMIEVEDHTLWQGQWLAGDVLEFLYTLGLIPVARDFEWWPYNYNVLCVRHNLLVRGDVRLALDRFYSSAGEKMRIEKQSALMPLQKQRKLKPRLMYALRNPKLAFQHLKFLAKNWIRMPS